MGKYKTYMTNSHICLNYARYSIITDEQKQILKTVLDETEYDVFCSDGPPLRGGPSEQNTAAQ